VKGAFARSVPAAARPLPPEMRTHTSSLSRCSSSHSASPSRKKSVISVPRSPSVLPLGSSKTSKLDPAAFERKTCCFGWGSDAVGGGSEATSTLSAIRKDE
jgi:hypothetical protein